MTPAYLLEPILHFRQLVFLGFRLTIEQWTDLS